MTPTPGEVWRHDETGEFREVKSKWITWDEREVVNFFWFGNEVEQTAWLTDFLAWQSHATRVWPTGDEK